MINLFRLLALAALGLLLTSQTRADLPCNANVKFQFNVNFGPPGGVRGAGGPYKAPWYLYFPVDPCMNSGMNPMGPAPSRFPNWPCQFPPPDAGACSVAPPCLPESTPTITPQAYYRYPTWPAYPYGRPNGEGATGNIILTNGSMAPTYWQPVSYHPYGVPSWPAYYGR